VKGVKLRHSATQGEFVMYEFKRTDRIADQIQRDLSELLRSAMKDPRLGMVTINEVTVSKDLGYADVYITLLTLDDLDENAPEIRQTLGILKKASGFLRSELGKQIKLRTIPQLRFHYDSSVKRGRDLDALIRKAREKDHKYEPAGSQYSTSEGDESASGND